ncbi:hypothetical protein GGF50DRAFT_60006 [Schizophyllum commune]
MLRGQIFINVSMMSAIRQLPAEVLALVFDAMLEDYDPFVRPTIAAGSIARVCCAWSHVARGMSHVWRYLCGGCEEECHDHSVSRLRATAKFAGCRLLRMRWSISATRGLWAVLVQYADRWDHLELTGSWVELASLPILCLPRLRGIEVILHGPASPCHFRILEGAPLLQRLVVEALPPYGGSDDGRDEIVRSFPFFRRTSEIMLTHLALDLSIAPLLSAVKQLLFDCRSSLIRLALSGDVIWDCDLEGSGFIHMEVLQEMQLGWEACQLARVTVAPRLHSLVMRNLVAEDTDVGAEAHNAFKTVLGLFRDAQHAPKLRRLELRQVDSAFPDAEGDFHRVAHWMTDLEELVIDNSDRSFRHLASFNGIISHLQCCNSAAPYFPSLISLTLMLGSCGASWVTHRLLWCVLHCRRRAHVCGSRSVAQLAYVMTDVRSGRGSSPPLTMEEVGNVSRCLQQIASA